MFGGILEKDSDNQMILGDKDDSKVSQDVYFNSYIHMFIFISGLSAIIMAFLGCCTSKVPDRCCVMTFSMFSLLTFTMFSVLTIIMMTLNLKN